MRLIEIFVPSDDRVAIESALDEMGVEYLFVDEDSSRDGSVANIPVPGGAVETVLERLYDAGLDEDTYTVVTDVERANIPNVEELTDRYVEGPRGDRGASHPEIRERAEDLKPEFATYVAFSALSAIVAVGGLLLDSAIVIVGAMVIAPFAGSTLSASVGTVIGDRGMVVESARAQVVGLVVAFVGAVLMGLLLRQAGFVPGSLVVARVEQVSVFLTPNLLTVVIAIAAGLAGALALATDLPVSIAGVAVAAAIVPAASAAGIGVVWGEPLMVLGAIVLLLMNIVFINLSAYVALVSLGYRSSVLRSLREDFVVSPRTGGYALLVVLFGVVVALTAAGTYQHVVFEQDVNQEVQATMDDPAYSTLELGTVQTDYNHMNVLSSEISVTVAVTRSTDAAYPELDETLQTRISEATGRPVTVNVQFQDVERAEPDPSETRSSSLVARLFDRLGAFGQRVTREVGASSV